MRSLGPRSCAMRAPNFRGDPCEARCHRRSVTPEPTQSMCATHGDVPATATCSRCGRFVCHSCTLETEPVLCAACDEVAADPFRLKRTEFSVGTALLEGAKLAWLEAGPILAVAFVFAIPGVIIEILIPDEPGQTLGTSWRVSVMYESLIAFIGAQAVLARLIARAEGRVLPLGRAFTLSLQTWGRCLSANIRAGLSTFGYSLLLIVPGFWRAVRLSFVDIAVLRSTKEPLLVSKEAVENRGWAVFGLVCATFAATWLPALMVTVVLGAAGELLKLQRPASLLGGWLMNVSGMVQSSVMLVAYYGLARSRGERLPSLPFRAPLA